MRAKRVISFSPSPLFLALSSTSFTMRVAALSAYALVVRISTARSRLSIPLISSAPSATSTGADSPVREEASMAVLPSITTPSSGTRLCGAICSTVPIATSFAGTSRAAPPSYITATSGRISASLRMSRRDFSTALSSRISPIPNRTVTAAASTKSPRAIAAATATVIRVVSSSRSLKALLIPSRITSYPEASTARMLSTVQGISKPSIKCITIAAANMTAADISRISLTRLTPSSSSPSSDASSAVRTVTPSSMLSTMDCTSCIIFPFSQYKLSALVAKEKLTPVNSGVFFSLASILAAQLAQLSPSSINSCFMAFNHKSGAGVPPITVIH